MVSARFTEAFETVLPSFALRVASPIRASLKSSTFPCVISSSQLPRPQ